MMKKKVMPFIQYSPALAHQTKVKNPSPKRTESQVSIPAGLDKITFPACESDSHDNSQVSAIRLSRCLNTLDFVSGKNNKQV